MNDTSTTQSATDVRKRRWRILLMSLAPIGLALGVYFYIAGGRFQSTDDAYTQAGTVSVSANIPGRVVEIAVHDNQVVKRGDLLYRLDENPYRIAVDSAAARLAGVKLQIASLKATYRQRQTELRSAQESLSYAKTQFERNKRLLSSGIASQAQYDQASNGLNVAEQQVANVEQQIAVAVANLGGSPNVEPEDHPLVKQAQADLDRAKLELSYTTVYASIDGIVSQVERLQVGDYVAASAPVFSLVSIRNVWIEANFKEVQLARMREGQTAMVKIDRFPGRQYRARIMSLSPATGSQSSLLPPENATGNWVKVVQRVPVRLQILDGEPAMRLQAGLSAYVKVDTESPAERTGEQSAQSEGDASNGMVAAQ